MIIVAKNKLKIKQPKKSVLPAKLTKKTSPPQSSGIDPASMGAVRKDD